jgi:hypothetical protein
MVIAISALGEKRWISLPSELRSVKDAQSTLNVVVFQTRPFFRICL